ncbi:TetR/AcrR family transcriptional regulator [Rhodococcus sp. D2-41]|nr:TetR/AcrR family transcriptional regulator [Rhodococcus sp. D2-41]
MTPSNIKDALVEAGITLLEETGSPDLGLREIARRAGVSHGAPRRWFPTHKALLAAIAAAGLRDLEAELHSDRTDPVEQILAFADAYIDFAVRRPAMFTLMFRHDLLEGSGADLREVSRPLFIRLVTLIERLESDHDATLSAAALWSGLHGIAVLAPTGALGLTVPDFDSRTLIRHMVSTELD